MAIWAFAPFGQAELQAAAGHEISGQMAWQISSLKYVEMVFACHQKDKSYIVYSTRFPIHLTLQR